MSVAMIAISPKNGLAMVVPEDERPSYFFHSVSRVFAGLAVHEFTEVRNPSVSWIKDVTKILDKAKDLVMFSTPHVETCEHGCRMCPCGNHGVIMVAGEHYACPECVERDFKI